MLSATVSTTIAAPIERVFQTLAEVESFQRAIPHVVGIEFLSERRSGVGTRFRETRVVGGREATTELEVVECEPNDHIRMVADSHGTVWDSIFAVREVAEGTELTLTMEARPHQLLAKLTVPMAMAAVRGALESDMEEVKRYCEAGAAETGGAEPGETAPDDDAGGGGW